MSCSCKKGTVPSLPWKRFGPSLLWSTETQALTNHSLYENEFYQNSRSSFIKALHVENVSHCRDKTSLPHKFNVVTNCCQNDIFPTENLFGFWTDYVQLSEITNSSQ